MESFPEPTDELLDTRERLLAAAALTLAGGGAIGASAVASGRAALARVVATQTVVNRARVERTHLYRAFPAQLPDEESHDRFVREVIDYVLQQQFLFEGLELAAEGDAFWVASPNDAREVVTQFAISQFAARDPSGLLIGELGHRAAMALWALDGDDDAVRDGLRRVYSTGTEHAAAFYARVLDAWGCALGDDFTTTEVAVVLTALLEGMSIRSRFEPTAVDPDGSLFARVVEVFVSALLQPAADTRPLAPERFNVVQTRADRRLDRSDDAAPSQESVRRAARALFEAAVAAGRDPRGVTSSEIASKANCSTSTVERLWGGTTLLVVDYFYALMATAKNPETDLTLDETLDRLSHAATNLTSDDADRQDVKDYFLRVLGRMLYETARFAHAHPLVAAAGLPAIEYGSADASGPTLRDQRDQLGHRALQLRFKVAIDAGQKLKILRDEETPEDLGNLLPVTVLHQMIRRPDGKPMTVAEMVYDTLLRGLAEDPGSMPSSRSATRFPIPEARV